MPWDPGFASFGKTPSRSSELNYKAIVPNINLTKQKAQTVDMLSFSSPDPIHQNLAAGLGACSCVSSCVLVVLNSKRCFSLGLGLGFLPPNPSPIHKLNRPKFYGKPSPGLKLRLKYGPRRAGLRSS